MFKNYIARQGEDWYLIQVPTKEEYTEGDIGCEGFFRSRIKRNISKHLYPRILDGTSEVVFVKPIENDPESMEYSLYNDYIEYDRKVANKAILMGDISIAFTRYIRNYDEVHEYESTDSCIEYMLRRLIDTEYLDIVA